MRSPCLLQLLEQKCAELTDDNARLTSELNKCRRIISDQSTEIASLTSSNATMSTKLEKSGAKVKKLVIQIDESKLELAKAQKIARERDAAATKLENDLKQLIQELAEKTKQFNDKELANDKLVKQLRALIDDLELKVTRGQDENGRLQRTIQMLRDEIEMLKRKLSSDTRFRQFVDVKREYNTLKDVSGTLAQKVQIYENDIPLPVVKKSGRTATKKSNVSGCGTRPRSSILNRPKSVRNIIRPPTADSSVCNMADFDDFDDLSRPQSSASVFRSGGNSRSQSAMGGPVTYAVDDSMDAAGLTNRLTSLMRPDRPASSTLVRSASALSHTRTVRINDSPIEMTSPKFSAATLRESPEPLHSALKQTTRRHSNSQELSDQHISAIELVANENHPCGVLSEEGGERAAEPAGRLSGSDDDDDEVLSELSFADFKMDDIIDL